MLLKSEFEIQAGLEPTWALVTDLERIAPCLPGATLYSRDGGDYVGAVTVKAGPISAHFAGTASFAKKDDAAYSAVITAWGKDLRGQATAEARIHAWLERVNDTRTRVLVDTNLDITGKMARFGRGALADASSRFFGQFAENLVPLLEEPRGPAVPADAPAAFGVAVAHPAAASVSSSRASSPGDTKMDVTRPIVSVKDRYGHAIAGGLICFVLGWLIVRRRTRAARS